GEEGGGAVPAAGRVTAKSAGETHVMVRFGGQATVARVTLPYAKAEPLPQLPPRSGEGVASSPSPLRGGGQGGGVNNFIDEKLTNKWRDLGLTPSPLCDDAEFFRRIHLDGIGTLPAPADVKKFLADIDPMKREKAIDAVLSLP